MAMVDVYD